MEGHACTEEGSGGILHEIGVEVCGGSGGCIEDCACLGDTVEMGGLERMGVCVCGEHDAGTAEEVGQLELGVRVGLELIFPVSEDEPVISENWNASSMLDASELDLDGGSDMMYLIQITAEIFENQKQNKLEQVDIALRHLNTEPAVLRVNQK
ncbi:hypothetical protein N7456_012937 [Penicillium angulare]|uniref:Uncharacterized protein n=1 Tax=Penicillium angulare TaxID=116970 RepID=A0A9W9EKR8_9EURO|nr:hypothetical protein N7456_012937 [Penicillium angulare]